MKSGDCKTRGIDQTSETGERTAQEEKESLKKSDISKDEVVINVSRITSITPLKSRIT